MDEFDEPNIEFDQIISADDRTLVIDVLARGIGKQSRARVDVPFTMLVRFRDGLVHRVRNFQWKDRDGRPLGGEMSLNAYNPADFAPDPRGDATGRCPAGPGSRSGRGATEEIKR